MIFKIITTCECISEYMIEADSEDLAREKFNDSDYISEIMTDFRNEEVVQISEV